jgi:hypothetical protein
MTVPVLMRHSFKLVTSKHGDFFKSVESTPAVAATLLSVFLTGCKGDLCLEGFRFSHVTLYWAFQK